MLSHRAEKLCQYGNVAVSAENRILSVFSLSLSCYTMTRGQKLSVSFLLQPLLSWFAGSYWYNEAELDIMFNKVKPPGDLMSSSREDLLLLESWERTILFLKVSFTQRGAQLKSNWKMKRQKEIRDHGIAHLQGTPGSQTRSA